MDFELNQDFVEFVALLNANQVKYVVLGGDAVGWYGYPRYTKDMDFFVERSDENAEAIWKSIVQFGLAAPGFTKEGLLEENACFFVGRAPRRVDILNFAAGLTFEQAWQAREEAVYQGV